MLEIGKNFTCPKILELFLNANSVTKIFVITVKGFEPATSRVRDQNTTTALETHIAETVSLN